MSLFSRLSLLHHTDHPAPANPTLIAPECHAPDCHYDGDQYVMVKCRCCGHWFCPEHVDAEESVRLINTTEPAVEGLSYYLGLCLGCRGAMRQQHPTNSAWLL
jgi:hypothetical protein